MTLRYLSLFSGIEAATVAWKPLGWECVAVSEIEKFPCELLAQHYPGVPNLGDVTKVTEADIANLGRIDLVVFGSPCQDLSVAGKRKGLDGARSGLFFTALDIIGWAREWGGCRFALWENVPGAFSSHKGADFAAVVGALAGLDGTETPPKGWGTEGCAVGPEAMVEWATLDAQWFGVAQRRRRVFALADFGDWSSRPPILLEPEGLRGDSAPSRSKGQGVAGVIATGTRSGGEQRSVLIPSTGDVSHCLNAGGMARIDYETETMVVCSTGDVARTLRGEGFDAIQDVRGLDKQQNGCGWNDEGTSYTLDTHATQRVAYSECEALYNKGFVTLKEGNASTQETYPGTLLRTLLQEVGEETFTKWGLGILDSLQSPEILRQALHGFSIRSAAFSRSWVVYCALSRQKNGSGWLLQSLRETGCEGCPPQGWKPPEQFAGELGAYLSELSQPGAQASRFMRDLWRAAQGSGLLREALSAVQEMGQSSNGESQSAYGTMRVRRLTCEEAEFLQGFPRGYTAIPWRKKPASECPDGPRYKALGNSMCVNVMHWIGREIDFVWRFF